MRDLLESASYMYGYGLHVLFEIPSLLYCVGVYSYLVMALVLNCEAQVLIKICQMKCSRLMFS